MTKHIILALALSLGSVTLAAPAYACGGYGAVDPVVSLVDQAVRTHAARVWRRDVAVYDVRRQGDDRATASIQWREGRTTLVRQLELRHRRGQWRVVRVVA